MKKNTKWILLGLLLGTVVSGIAIGSFLVYRNVSKIHAYTVSSESMEPTLKRGSTIFVDKSDETIATLKSGDIVIIEPPESLRTSNPEVEVLVKRIVGMPGETVEGRCEEGKTICKVQIFIDDKLFVEKYVSGDEYAPFGPIAIGDDQVFTLGDNRAKSSDGRVYGPSSIQTVVGIAKPGLSSGS